MVDLQQLRQLVAIQDAGSLSAAAEALHLSQPALSRSMQRLESELGLTLFERSRNRLSFGPVGLRAAENARALLLDAERFTDELRDYAARLSILRVGAPSPAPLWLLSLEIRERFQNFTVAEEQQDAERLLAGLLDGYFRLILTDSPIGAEGLLCRKYVEERLLLELTPGHPLSAKNGLTAEDLRGLTLLAYRNVGFWRERLFALEGIHIIEQTDLNVLEDLALSTGLPLITSSLGPMPAAKGVGRISVPILEENAVQSFFLCAREEDASLFEQLC